MGYFFAVSLKILFSRTHGPIIGNILLGTFVREILIKSFLSLLPIDRMSTYVRHMPKGALRILIEFWTYIKLLFAEQGHYFDVILPQDSALNFWSWVV